MALQNGTRVATEFGNAIDEPDWGQLRRTYRPKYLRKRNQFFVYIGTTNHLTRIPGTRIYGRLRTWTVQQTHNIDYIKCVDENGRPLYARDYWSSLYVMHAIGEFNHLQLFVDTDIDIGFFSQNAHFRRAAFDTVILGLTVAKDENLHFALETALRLGRQGCIGVQNIDDPRFRVLLKSASHIFRYGPADDPDLLRAAETWIRPEGYTGRPIMAVLAQQQKQQELRARYDKLTAQLDAAKHIKPNDPALCEKIMRDIGKLLAGPYHEFNQYPNSEIEMVSAWRVTQNLDGRGWYVDGD